jgi:hypothetical protein
MMHGTSSAGDVIARHLARHDAAQANAESQALGHPRSVTINRQIIEAAASGRDAIGCSATIKNGPARQSDQTPG